MPKLRLAILGSTRGTAMQAIITAIKQNQLDACIELVISNKPQALILERAQAQQLKTLVIDDKEKGQEGFEQGLSTVLHTHSIDLLVLIGYMRILSSSFVQQWTNIINIHPSLLPNFAGLRDLEVHQAVLNSGHKISGCSVHYVTEEVDKGPLLIQKKCLVYVNDNKESLKARVQLLEGGALVGAISLFLKANSFL